MESLKKRTIHRTDKSNDSKKRHFMTVTTDIKIKVESKNHNKKGVYPEKPY